MVWTKDEKREYDAIWIRSKPGESARVDAWQKEHPEEFKAQQQRYREKNRLKINAQAVARRALKAGKLVRTTCEKCGFAVVEMHHDDYSKPLAVRWLCRKCHKKFHRKYQ